ncbi:hypothetical protein CPB84DRAFT_1851150 [Gymnopilus junonius]|uniref:Uncharacterized protein n=1 Tax=Gymnopilus junonius TaxID=109634 RepID=A0A9P5NGZ1_GYMJU|nr:hypothetical protein CPB84DRAFT_1851150 [Gymnopilus junonius]
MGGGGGGASGSGGVSTSAWGVSAGGSNSAAGGETDEEEVRRRARMRGTAGRRVGGSRAAAWMENGGVGAPLLHAHGLGLGTVGSASLLTELRADFTTTTTTTTTYTSSPPHNSHNPPLHPHPPTPPLPQSHAGQRDLFRALDMGHAPPLASLGDVGGFRLELGHSSGDIEEAWVTQPPHANANANANQAGNANPAGNANANTTSPTDHPFSIP